MHCNMNDADVAFTNFYGAVGNQLQQHTDLSLSTPIHAQETDNFPGIFDDDSPFLSIPLATTTTVTAGTAAATHKSSTSNVETTACIPFVQIHTTDLQQPEPEPSRSYRNRFRRNKTAEIKSEAELIKSELAEAAAKERINATPTPPTAKTIHGDSCTDLPLNKCPNCPFLSLCSLKTQAHINNCFGIDAQRRLLCPGCANLFYNMDVLNLHLSADHLLEPPEISTLLLRLTAKPNVVPTKKPPPLQTQTLPKSRIYIKNVDCLREPHRDVCQDVSQLPDFLPPDDNILDLLEDVDTVRDRAHEQSQQQQQQELPVAPSVQKLSVQKISIKSVDVLREPALLSFDFQVPSAATQQTQSQFSQLSQEQQQAQHHHLEHQLPQQLPALPGLMMSNNILDVPVVGVQNEKPRHPKIYIRNVDILKEPMLLPGMGFGNARTSTVASPVTEVFTAETLLTPTGQVGTLPTFEPALAPLSNMCNESFNFESVLSGSAGTVSSGSSNNFSALDLEFGVDFPDSVQLVTEPTPPPPLAADHTIANREQQQQQQQQQQENPQPPHQQPSHLTDLAPPEELNRELDDYLPVAVTPPPAGGEGAAAAIPQPAPPAAATSATITPATSATTATTATTKQKIFIKNVDILKAPQRGTLHLRTVDELNLMNRNEVEHLIVPNRDVDMPLNPPVVALEPSLVDFPQEPPQVPISYDLPDGLDDWHWMEEAVSTGMSANDSDHDASELDLPTNAEDILIKNFPQLYTQQAPNTVSVPPLVPVTGSPIAAASVAASADNLSSLPVPPLVPLANEAPHTEKTARIYVANNLLPVAVEQPLAGGTSVRGRPYGAKQAGRAKRRPSQRLARALEGSKCTVDGCMFRFKSPATLQYHVRCHNGPLGAARSMICPECRSTQFSNWNCLHTHLWRTHEIDMELYCCQLCTFKTPIYSRLVNTHAKIHSEERNYKCEQCGKGFKNTKQLKNHRRLHRTQGLAKRRNNGSGNPQESQPSEQSDQATVLPVLHSCDDCGAAFKHRKTLREHLCKKRNEQPQCPTCQRVFSSKSSLKLHMRSHQASKRFKCDKCDYEGHDHNAFRRHLGTHRDMKRYACPHCDFRSVQSTAYRIHLQRIHPELELTAIIHKCNECKFSTINHGLLLVHQAKHHSTSASVEPSKIKVRSSLLLAHSTTKEQELEPDELSNTQKV